ncbi:hypothetical protein KM043_000092 [Ampulex compressa]|nr:hypothetical protein KM043_000092 [Ampulex compressa]
MATFKQLIETQMSFSYQIISREVSSPLSIIESPPSKCSGMSAGTCISASSQHRTLKRGRTWYTSLKTFFSSIVEAVDEICNYSAAELQKQMELSAATGPVSASAPTSAAASASESKVTLQFPPINLGRFTGDLNPWMAFRDMFLSLVDTQTNLSPVQKLHYGKTSFDGEAGKTLASVEVCSANYTTAWEKLFERHQPRPRFATRESPGLGHTDRAPKYFPSDQPVGGPIHLPHPGEIEHCHATGLGSRAGLECIPYCSTFLGKPVSQRIKIVRNFNPCVNCSRLRHLVRTCPSSQTYQQCKQKHHTLLHLERSLSDVSTSLVAPATTLLNQSASSNMLTERRVGAVSNHLGCSGVNRTILLTTSILLRSASGRSLKVRALLDQGSQAPFIAQSAVQILLPVCKSVSVLVTAIGDTRIDVARQSAAFSVEPCTGSQPVIRMTALMQSNLTGYDPSSLSADTLPNFLRSLPLVDTDLHRSEPIQFIIKADFFDQILLDGVIHSSLGSPLAQRTIFGWVLSGNCCVPASTQASVLQSSVVYFNHVAVVDPLQKSLRSFWELEEVP